MHIRQAGSVLVVNSEQLQNVSSTVTDTKINLVNKLTSAGNSSYDCKVKSDCIYRTKENNWNFKSLLEFFGFPKKEKDKELERILFEGKTLQHQAGLTRNSLAEKYMIHPPAFSLKNKKLAASAVFLNYTLQNHSLADSSMLSSVNENNKGHHYMPSGSSYYLYEKQLVDSHRFNQDAYNVDSVTKTHIDPGYELKEHEPFLKLSKKRNINKRLVRFFNENNIPECNNTKITEKELLSVVAKYIFNGSNDCANNMDKVKELSRYILKVAGQYGAIDGESLSYERAEVVIRHWFFLHVLGMMPSEYIAKERARQPNPDMYSCYGFFQSLTRERNNLMLECRNGFKYIHDCYMMINYMFDKEIPDIIGSIFKIMTTLFSDSYFASFYVGDRFLKGIDLSEYSPEEAVAVGDIVWDLAINEKKELYFIDYFTAPALFFMAGNTPKRLAEGKKITGKTLFLAINEFVKYRTGVKKITQSIINAYDNHRQAINNLIENQKKYHDIYRDCYPEFSSLASEMHKKTVEKKYERGKFLSNAITSSDKQCLTILDRSKKEYNKQVPVIVDSFYHLEQSVIRAALYRVSKKERDFIFNAKSNVFSFDCNHDICNIIPCGHYHYEIHDMLKKTKVIVVINNMTTIFYKLQVDDLNVYSLIKIEPHLSYIFNRVFHDEYFSPERGGRKWKSIPNGNSFNGLIKYFSLAHKNYLYEALCNERENFFNQQGLSIIMSLLTPYYEGNKESTRSESIIDIPIALRKAIHFISSQEVRLSSEKLMNGNDRSQIFLNEKMSTITKLLLLKQKELKNINFEFETINGFSKFFLEKIIAHLHKNKGINHLSTKIILSKFFEKSPSISSKNIIFSFLPNSNVSVPVIRIGRVKKSGVYAMINYEKDEVFGRYYKLNDGMLNLIKKPHGKGSAIILDGITNNTTGNKVIEYDYCELKLHRELGFTNDFEKCFYDSTRCSWLAPISYLKENTDYYNIIVTSMKNLCDLSDIALKNLSHMKDYHLINFYKIKTGITIARNDCFFLRDNMLNVTKGIHYYSKHFELLFKFARDHYNNDLAYFTNKNIILMPKLFDYKYPGFLIVILHEIFHSIGMGDFFYHLSLDSDYRNDINFFDYLNSVKKNIISCFSLYEDCFPGAHFYEKLSLRSDYVMTREHLMKVIKNHSELNPEESKQMALKNADTNAYFMLQLARLDINGSRKLLLSPFISSNHENRGRNPTLLFDQNGKGEQCTVLTKSIKASNGV